MSVLHSLAPLSTIAACTRWLQARQPQRPLRGLTRFVGLMARLLPPYRGVITMPNGSKMLLDSRQRAERWLMFSGSYQPSVTLWLNQHMSEGYYCIDAGANLGFYSLLMGQHVGPTGQIAVFEPNPALAARLREQIALNDFNNVQVIEKAVHHQQETLTFHIASDPGKSSIYADHAAVIERITVEATTLDAFITAAGWQRLDLIKMDIEGNDCYGLLGAGEALRRFRPHLIFEYSATTPPNAAAAVMEMFAALNYQLTILNGDGSQARFDWREVRSGHVDVIAVPGISAS